jgi:ankyrin repeat protein
LPETLDETYERTLREINKADWEFAHRLFQFVTVASYPLRVEELAELLAFDFRARPVPKFHEGWRLEDPIDAVLSTCSSLLSIVDGGSRYPFGMVNVIQFSHFSVKEFLTSVRLAEASDIIPRRYHISMTPAHTLVAKACLGILLHLDKDVTSDSLEKWPLANYAAKHWADHVQFDGVSQNVEDGMKQLFDPDKTHLAVCIGIYDVLWALQGPPWERAERPRLPLKTSLHYAAHWDLHFIVEFLVIQRSQDVHSRGLNGDLTPLHLASHEGHIKVSRMLIECGADVSARTNGGHTPLHVALARGKVEVARMLIEHGADVTAQNEDGQAPLHLMSSPEIALILLERGADVTAQTKDGETPLHRASSPEVARILLERGADVTAKTKDGLTPLHLALNMGKVEVARVLIEHGADVTARSEYGWTPLHGMLSPEVARMLIERGADVKAQTTNGDTPLLRVSSLEVADMLIEHGADVTAQNKERQTPLHLASNRGQVEVARMLIERGADMSARTTNGETPLHQVSSPEVTRMLIESGADVAAQNKDGNTPLHLVLTPSYFWVGPQGRAEGARLLLEHGADVNAQNKDGNTPLHLVSTPSDTWVGPQDRAKDARILLEHGADVNAQNKSGLTPIRLAQTSSAWRAEAPELPEVIRILLQHGADLVPTTTRIELHSGGYEQGDVVISCNFYQAIELEANVVFTVPYDLRTTSYHTGREV